MQDESENATPEEDIVPVEVSWWCTSLGNTLIWARMVVYTGGVAEVLAPSGEITRYDSEISARMELLAAHYYALDGGGSQGIGRAAAIELAQLGAHVTLLARTAESLESALAELPRVHEAQDHGYLAVDVNDAAALRVKVESAANAHPFHILINNTGGPPGGTAHEAEAAAFVAAFPQHLLANQTLLQAVLPGMKGAGYGRIVNVISTSVKEPIRNLGVSNTIRGAVASWVKSQATELGPFGITVNNVLPGYP